ncbi:hypothetical protein QTV44_002580 [Vibrio vulnificus]|nr:hypothetical protein [Vibrio vulnificus]
MSWFEVGEHIQTMRKRSGIWMMAAALVFVSILGCYYYYAHLTLKSAGGVFSIKANIQDGIATIPTTQIVDRQHYYDDRVAMTQNMAARLINNLFSQTTESYLRINQSIQDIAIDTAPQDFLTNLEHHYFDKHLKRLESVKRLSWQFSNGVPRVIDVEFVNPDISVNTDLNSLNTADVKKWTLETEGLLALSIVTGDTVLRRRMRFNFDVVSLDHSYEKRSFRITRISLMEVLR